MVGLVGDLLILKLVPVDKEVRDSRDILIPDRDGEAQVRDLEVFEEHQEVGRVVEGEEWEVVDELHRVHHSPEERGRVSEGDVDKEDPKDCPGENCLDDCSSS